jgi:hypothetical protein
LRILQTENRISQSIAKKPLAEKPSFIAATALEKQSILKENWRFIGLDSMGQVASGERLRKALAIYTYRVEQLAGRQVGQIFAHDLAGFLCLQNKYHFTNYPN